MTVNSGAGEGDGVRKKMTDTGRWGGRERRKDDQAGVGSEEEQPMGTAEHGIRTDDLEVTELQKASWEGKSKTDWKERRKRENLGQKNHTLDCPLHWTPKNTQLRCA